MEETKATEKFIKTYNDYMLWKEIEVILEIPILSFSFITAIILFFRLQGTINLITFFITIFVFIFLLFLKSSIDSKFDVFLPENFEKFLVFVEFLSEEELEGMELGVEEATRFAEWQKKRKLF